MSASGGYFLSRFVKVHFGENNVFKWEIVYSDSSVRISEKNGTNSAKNHGKRMNFHRFYEHHKSFIEFWSASALFHFTKRGSAKSEQHVCFSPSCDPIEKYHHQKHAFSQGNNAFLVSNCLQRALNAPSTRPHQTGPPSQKRTPSYKLYNRLQMAHRHIVV